MESNGSQPMKTAHKVLVALVIVVAASLWAVSGSSTTDVYRDVHEVASDPDRFAASPVTMEGQVVAGTISTDGGLVRFLLRDTSGNPAHGNTTLPVTYAGPLPDAFGPKDVVVTGTVLSTPDGPGVQATNIQVGCSSKY